MRKKTRAHTRGETVSVAEDTHTRSVCTHADARKMGFCPTFLLPVVKAEWKLFLESYKTFFAWFLSMKKFLNSD